MSALSVPADAAPAQAAPAAPTLSLVGAPESAAPCLHCQRRPGNKRRGLCRRCYYAPGVRDLYPVIDSPHNNKFQRPDQPHNPPLARKPTPAPPGSVEKLLVMRDRISAGRRAFHPGDRPMDPEEPPPGVLPDPEPVDDLDDIFPPIEDWGAPGGRLSPGLAEVLGRLHGVEGLPVK